MHITIKLIYKGWESKILMSGTFQVIERKFKEDPNKEAARVAKKWIEEVRREHHVSMIVSVFYNGDHDITSLIDDF